uniref:Rho-GAP domain-containing protein n=1 Tax=Palpitomonas bilix TaxID=652834 RepID=A0A7S3DGU0_9EUKA
MEEARGSQEVNVGGVTGGSKKKGGLAKIENGFKSAFSATSRFFKNTGEKVAESKFGQKMKEAGKKTKALGQQMVTSTKDGKVAQKFQRFGDNVNLKMNELFKKDHNKAPVFGVAIRLYQLRHPGRLYPFFVENALDFVASDGLGRPGIFVTPVDASLPLALRRAIDHNEAAMDLSKSGEPHVVAELLRQYFRDMPEPLFGFKGSEVLVGIARDEVLHNTDTIDVDAYASAIMKLQPANRAMVRKLLSTLHAVHEQAAINGVSIEELGMSLGPLILRPKSKIALFVADNMLFICRALRVSWCVSLSVCICMLLYIHGRVPVCFIFLHFPFSTLTGVVCV